MTITASEFKAKCLRLMDHVHQSGETITITKRGKEVARLQPPPPTKKPWERLHGTVTILGDIVSPIFRDEDFDAITGRELQHLRSPKTKRARRKKR